MPRKHSGLLLVPYFICQMKIKWTCKLQLNWRSLASLLTSELGLLLPQQKTLAQIYFDYYTFVVMVLFSSDGLCRVDHERIPNDVYWHGKGKIHSGSD